MPAQPITRNRVIAALKESGEPMTRAEIGEAIGWDRDWRTLGAALKRAHQSGHLRIAGYRRNFVTSGKPSPLWAIADGRPDAPELRFDPIERRRQDVRRYNERTRAVRAMKDRARRGYAITPMSLMTYTPAPERRKRIES